MIDSSMLGDPPVFDNDCFPWARDLESQTAAIREEFEAAVMTYQSELPGVEELSPDHARIAGDRQWRSFFLYGYGYRSEVACQACPLTAGVLEQIPDLETAFFSILRPGAHLPPHRGVTKALITCHLPLIVPSDAINCWIQLETERYSWRPGSAFLFDDTRRHEVRNDTDEARVVLLIHVRRPLRFPGSLAGSVFLGAVKLSPFKRDGVRNQQAWEAKYRKLSNDQLSNE